MEFTLIWNPKPSLAFLECALYNHYAQQALSLHCICMVLFMVWEEERCKHLEAILWQVSDFSVESCDIVSEQMWTCWDEGKKWLNRSDKQKPHQENSSRHYLHQYIIIQDWKHDKKWARQMNRALSSTDTTFSSGSKKCNERLNDNFKRCGSRWQY